jgi:hypothetical protein
LTDEILEPVITVSRSVVDSRILRDMPKPTISMNTEPIKYDVADKVISVPDRTGSVYNPRRKKTRARTIRFVPRYMREDMAIAVAHKQMIMKESMKRDCKCSFIGDYDYTMP